MRTDPHTAPVSLETHMRHARRLRSRAAISLFSELGRVIGDSLTRAFVRPYRMSTSRGCHGEA